MLIMTVNGVAVLAQVTGDVQDQGDAHAQVLTIVEHARGWLARSREACIAEACADVATRDAALATLDAFDDRDEEAPTLRRIRVS